MDPAYGAYYRTLYEQHWWFRTREQWVLQEIRRIATPRVTQSILDVGCGDALFFDRLLEFGDVQGVETSRELIHPKNPHRRSIHIGPLDDSFQPGKQFSLILMLDVVEHILTPLAVLQRCRELLQPGGSLLITVPAFNLAWTNHDVINHHVTRYRKATLFPLLSEAGFKIEESEYWFHWTFPVKLAERFIEKMLKLQPGNPTIPSPVVNRMLSQLCNLERTLLRPLRLPFGTTLFVKCTQ